MELEKDDKEQEKACKHRSKKSVRWPNTCMCYSEITFEDGALPCKIFDW